MQQRIYQSCTAGLCALVLISTGAAAGPVLPDFSAATFIPGAPVDHVYFPLVMGITNIYQGEKMEGGETTVERFELTPLGVGPTILGVQTMTQRDRAFEDDLLVEATFDYYAQDTVGNVWYFGEDATNFIYDMDDNLIGTTDSSSWLAGVNSALPGHIMPADLTPGINYYQEFAPFDAAIDEGTTLASDVELSIMIGNYSNVLAVLETLDTDPDVRAIKYYAPGFGLIAEDEGLNFSLMDPEIRLELISSVPLPAPIALLSFGIVSLFACSRRTVA